MQISRDVSPDSSPFLPYRDSELRFPLLILVIICLRHLYINEKELNMFVKVTVLY